MVLLKPYEDDYPLTSLTRSGQTAYMESGIRQSTPMTKHHEKCVKMAVFVAVFWYALLQGTCELVCNDVEILIIAIAVNTVKRPHVSA